MRAALALLLAFSQTVVFRRFPLILLTFSSRDSDCMDTFWVEFIA